MSVAAESSNWKPLIIVQLYKMMFIAPFYGFLHGSYWIFILWVHKFVSYSQSSSAGHMDTALIHSTCFVMIFN